MNLIYFLLLCTPGMVISETTRSPRCPPLSPPDKGVIQCQYSAKDLVCRATCQSGYKFETGVRIVIRVCKENTELWDFGEPLPSCVGDMTNITMTSSSNQDHFSPANSVVKPGMTSFNCWRSATDDVSQYIQIDFDKPHRLVGVMTKGDDVMNYVMLYRVLFSMDGITWYPYSDTKVSEKFFRGNSDVDQTQTNDFECPHVAKHVRINPLMWHNHISFRVNLLGCLPKTDEIHGKNSSVKVCRATLPPRHGNVNCETNQTSLICSSVCQSGFVFSNKEPVIQTVCDETTGNITPNSETPLCIEEGSSITHLVNTTGRCIYEDDDCSHVKNGDFHYCKSCHYFASCSEQYLYIRPCPTNLKYDSNKQRCEYKSTSCSDKS